MRDFGRARRAVRVLGMSLVVLAGVWLMAASGVGGQQPPAGAPTAPPSGNEECLACHQSADATPKMAIDPVKLAASPHASMKCQECHYAITAVPHTPEMTAQKATCGTCHASEAEAYASSIHSSPDKLPGDHPTCKNCHGGGDPHAIRKEKRTHRQVAELCMRCHSQLDRMARYHVDTDAVASYKESFHGKALLRFGHPRTATCTDCHTNHGVLNPKNPNAPTHPSNVASTCGKGGCHAGAKLNFAMSGANHLRLKVKSSAILHYEELGFKFLTIGTIVMLLLGVGLDIRKQVFSRGHRPLSGRLIGVLISLSFLALVVALALAFFGLHGAKHAATASLVILVIALISRAVRGASTPTDPGERTFVRLTVIQRCQHFCLLISFSLLVLTGMPLRFAETSSLHALYALFGGMVGARLVHRVAAVLMMGTWIWHTVYLIAAWRRAGFSLQSWTMWPAKKDFVDFFHAVLHYVGIKKEPPAYDRFQFREKFDYFAVYWGMPIMVFSGLVLWFPIFLGNMLPETSISVAYIAHSDEAILAFLAILLWHFYNTHFNPESFPMSPTFITGTKTLSQMQREHPVELERILAAEGAVGAAGEEQSAE